MREARLWYARDLNQTTLPGSFGNEIVFSQEFFQEITTHSVPSDLEAAKALSSLPAALDLYMLTRKEAAMGHHADAKSNHTVIGQFCIRHHLPLLPHQYRPKPFCRHFQRKFKLLQNQHLNPELSDSAMDRFSSE